MTTAYEVVYTNYAREMKVIINYPQKGCGHMPLTFAKAGEVNSIKKVGGKEETRKFLENLGFVSGSPVTVISELNGNIIVNIKETRVAINREMANKIIV